MMSLPQGRTATCSAVLPSFIRGVMTSITGPTSDASRLARGEPVTRRGMPSRLNVTTSAEPPIAMLSPFSSQSASST